MYRTAYIDRYTKRDRAVVGGIERLRDEAKSLRQKSPRQAKAHNHEVATAPKLDGETLTRKELGKLFNVSHEAIRLWEESGRLKELGWERIPHIKSPVKYSRTKEKENYSQLI